MELVLKTGNFCTFIVKHVLVYLNVESLKFFALISLFNYPTYVFYKPLNNYFCYINTKMLHE